MPKTRGLDGAQLKWIALVTMLLDHVGLTLVYVGYLLTHRVDRSPAALPLYWALRSVGRLAFPLYCFLLTEGLRHTHDRSRYLLRLLAFGLLSEIPFDLAFRRTWLEAGHQNVFFTLAIGLLALLLWEELTQGRGLQAPLRQKLPATLAIFGTLVLAWLLKTDYGAPGVLLIVVLYLLPQASLEQTLSVLAVLGLMIAFGSHWIELLGALSLLLIRAYNGERGKQPRALFYLFYPAHLLLLAGLRTLIW